MSDGGEACLSRYFYFFIFFLSFIFSYYFHIFFFFTITLSFFLFFFFPISNVCYVAINDGRLVRERNVGEKKGEGEGGRAEWIEERGRN